MKPLLTTLTLAFLILPLVTFAQYQFPAVQSDGTISEGLVPCEGAFCSTCDIVVLANTGIKWLLTLSFLFFAILALRAGWKLIISQGNSGALTEAKQSFTNAFIGLIIILVAWLLVDTLMRNVLGKSGVLSGGVIEGYGPWSQVKCVTQVEPKTAQPGYFEADILYEPPSYYSNVPISTGLLSGSIQQKINAATIAYRGSSTKAGPGAGNLACAWAVNNILRNAGVATVDGDSVVEMEKVLVQGRGKRINPSDAVAGDLVLLLQASTKSGKVGNHVGICLNNGCTSVLSNSSSKATFSWQSGPTFSPSYSGGSLRVYRITN